MSVNTKLTNLANEIREISGTTTKKSLDVMTSDISAANDLIDEQETLLNDLRDIVDTLPEPAQWDYGSSTLESNYGYTTYEVPYGVGYFYIDCSEYYATDLENVLLRINNSTIIDLSDYAPYNDITLYVYRGVIIIKNYASNLFIHDEGSEIYSIELQPVSQVSVSIDVDYEAFK